MACYIIEFPAVLADNEVLPFTCKIGKANDVQQRLRNLRTAWPYVPKNYWYIYPKLEAKYCSGMLFHIEKQAHKFFEDHRVRANGEFFTLGNKSHIEKALQRFIRYMDSIGFELEITQDPEKIKSLRDPALIDDVLESNNSAVHNLAIQPFQPDPNFDPTKRSTHLNIQKIQPREHQIEILAALNAWHQSNSNRGKLILPPGIGKSYITSMFIDRFVLPANLLSILILVPTKSIADNFAEALNACHLDYEIVHSEAASVDNVDFNNIIIMVNDTARGSAYDELAEMEFGLIVYDEAHHMCATENKNLLKLSSFKKLFLTATERIYEDKDVFDMSKPEFGDLIYKMTIGEAIEKRLLADYKLYLPNIHNTSNVVEQLIYTYERRKILVFANTIEESKAICEELKELESDPSEEEYDMTIEDERAESGLKVEVFHIDGSTSMIERTKIIRNFEKASCGILCNVNVIGEGVNIPCIDAVVFASCRASPIGIIQNIGRGLRVHQDKDFCMVVLHYKMISSRFVEGLLLYDERFHTGAKQMMIADKSPIRMTSAYSTNEIVQLIEIYDSRSRNELQKFVRALQLEGIFSEGEYRRKYQNNYTDERPIMPDSKYPNFKWILIEKSDETPTYTTKKEITDAINSILENPDVRKDIDKPELSVDKKIKILHTIDNKIPLDLSKVSNVKLWSHIHWIFNLHPEH